MPLSLEVATVVVRTEAERHRLEGVAPAVGQAFRELAMRLERTPAGRWDDLPAHITLTLETEAIQLDDLLSPRGAERLADEWYRQLMERR
jgi:hypothetical protein